MSDDEVLQAEAPDMTADADAGDVAANADEAAGDDDQAADDAALAPRTMADLEPTSSRWALLGLACIVALAIGVFVAAVRDDHDSTAAPEPSPTLQPGDTLPTGHPSLDGSDQFADLTLSQLESEVADESAPVALRLTLAERYLATGDVDKARRQARLARDQAGTDVDQQRALRDLGWAVALSGDARRGAELLTQALDITPGERNATWYLANVRLSGLDDPAGAADLFHQLLQSGNLDKQQRTAVQQRLAAAESASQSSATTAG